MKRFFAGLLIVSMTMLFGCGGGSSSSTPATYKITGSVKNGGNGIAGVTVATGSTSTTTDANGNYTLSPLTSGSYTVIPALAGYIFTPATLTVSVNEADSAGNNFTGSVIQKKITGMVKIGGNAIAGVTVGNGSTSAITDANGNYTLNTTSNGSYTVTPLLAGCTFTPPTLSVAVNGADSTGNNFSGTIPIIQRNSVGNIVGIQKDTSSNSVAGATAAIVVNGVTYTATSDANGVYDLILPANITQYLGDTFSYSVSKAGYIPISYTGNINTSIFQSTTPLVAGDNSYIVLEIPPLTHHLGDSSYTGAANSQFQYPRAEGLTWAKSFNLNTQPSQFQSATISFKAKGIQELDTVTVNSTVFTLANSDANGGYSDYSITVPLDAFKANLSNTITISSALGSDYDDFEFLNVIIKFSNDPVVTTPPTKSTFDSNDEGWKIYGNATDVPDYKVTLGNPGGYIEATDNVYGVWYFSAPSKFLGNNSSSYSKTLEYDLKQSSLSSQIDASDIILKGAGITLTYQGTIHPNITWTHFSVTLSEAGWKNGSANATKSDFQTVLASMTSLYIRGEFIDGADTGGLDNVILNK